MPDKKTIEEDVYRINDVIGGAHLSLLSATDTELRRCWILQLSFSSGALGYELSRRRS